jgi:hypothetical protein
MTPLDIIRAQVRAAMVLVGTAQEALKVGTNEPQEQPEVLLAQAIEALQGAFDGLTVVLARNSEGGNRRSKRSKPPRTRRGVGKATLRESDQVPTRRRRQPVTGSR